LTFKIGSSHFTGCSLVPSTMSFDSSLYGTPNRTKALVEDGGGLGEDAGGLGEDAGDSARMLGFPRGGSVEWRGW
jgi:hypothetical protein